MSAYHERARAAERLSRALRTQAALLRGIARGSADERRIMAALADAEAATDECRRELAAVGRGK